MAYTPVTVGISVDNTATAEAEEALRRNEVDLKRSNDELQQFAYIASHDLREPLRMVSSYLGFIDHKCGGEVLDAKVKGYMHFAVDGADRMSADGRRSPHLLAGGHAGQALAPVDMDEVLTVALKELRGLLRRAGPRSPTIPYRRLWPTGHRWRC